MIDRKKLGSIIGRELLGLSDELFGLWKKVWEGTLSKHEFASRMIFRADFRSRFNAALKRGEACGQLAGREVSLSPSIWPTFVALWKPAANRADRSGIFSPIVSKPPMPADRFRVFLTRK